jgi:hypothetical protein
MTIARDGRAYPNAPPLLLLQLLHLLHLEVWRCAGVTERYQTLTTSELRRSWDKRKG